MIQTREELEREVMAQYRTLGRTLKASSGTVWMDIDITIAQLRTLLVLAEEGPLVIGQIAQRLGVGLSTGGHLVDRLVQAGLAERAEDAEDRRLYARLLNHPLQIQMLIQRLDKDDLAALLQGLQAINRLVELESGADGSK
ncbi:MAG: MarR family transcriptional regulator [Chloroflexi bacterium]|nr:MAG: MarR family transcriptional regulator [Chloroflexota bacterium]